MNEDKTVGIIGVGHVGFALARNLVNAGFQVFGFRRSHLEAFVSIGEKPAESVGLRPPLLRAALPVYRAALESGRARDDTAAVIDFIGN